MLKPLSTALRTLPASARWVTLHLNRRGVLHVVDYGRRRQDLEDRARLRAWAEGKVAVVSRREADDIARSQTDEFSNL